MRHTNRLSRSKVSDLRVHIGNFNHVGGEYLVKRVKAATGPRLPHRGAAREEGRMKFVPVRIVPLPPHEVQSAMSSQSPLTARAVALAIVIALITFVLIAALGLLVAAAGGVRWGTGDAGAAAACTAVVALVASVIIGAFVLDESR